MNCFLSVLTVISVFLFPLQTSAASSSSDCCISLYETGYQVGTIYVYSALMPSERLVSRFAYQAYDFMAAARENCSKVNLAWPYTYENNRAEFLQISRAFEHSQSDLVFRNTANRILELRDTLKRELDYQIVANERIVKETCASNYFLLGYFLALSVQTFDLAADESIPAGQRQAMLKVAISGLDDVKLTLVNLQSVRPVTGSCAMLDDFIIEVDTILEIADQSSAADLKHSTTWLHTMIRKIIGEHCAEYPIGTASDVYSDFSEPAGPGTEGPAETGGDYRQFVGNWIIEERIYNYDGDLIGEANYFPIVLTDTFYFEKGHRLEHWMNITHLENSENAGGYWHLTDGCIYFEKGFNVEPRIYRYQQDGTFYFEKVGTGHRPWTTKSILRRR